VVLLSHDFNDFEPVLAVDQLLDYLNIPGPRYFLREGYSLESAKDNWQRFLWKLMEQRLEQKRLTRASEEDFNKADFVIQFSAFEKTKQNAPNLWPLYLTQD
jgi:hypothetical protein